MSKTVRLTMVMASMVSGCAAIAIALGCRNHQLPQSPQAEGELVSAPAELRRQLEDTRRKLDSTHEELAEAQRELVAAHQEVVAQRQEIVAQRELLRDQTLKTTLRTPDEFLALFPAPYPQGDWRPADDAFEDCWFRSVDGLRLHGWLLRHRQPRAAVLMLHGNAGNLTHRAGLAQAWSERYNVSFLVFDYRGYGRSEGRPTIAGLLNDARAARRELATREGIAETEVVLLGESLGGAVAVDLAASDGARALVLQSTFSSLKEVARQHYPRLLVDALVADKLDSARAIERYEGPLLQFHGDADRTIPLALAEKLFAAANEPKRLVVLPGHDHNDPLPAAYFEALAEFFEGPGRD